MLNQTDNISIFDILTELEYKQNNKSKVETLYEKLKNKSLKKTQFGHKDYVYNQKYICAVCGKITKESRTIQIKGPTNCDGQEPNVLYYSYDMGYGEGGHSGIYPEHEILKELNKLDKDHILVSDCGKKHFYNHGRKGKDNIEDGHNNVGKYLKQKYSNNL